MSTAWTTCRNDLIARYPDMDAEERNKILHAIWDNPDNKAEWMRHYKYSNYKKLEKDPDVEAGKGLDEYTPPGPDGTKPKKAKAKAKAKAKKKQVPDSDSSSSDSDTVPIKKSKKKNVKILKDADYYKQKYYKSKFKSK